MKHPHARRSDLVFHWPEPSLHVVLVEPEIPPNTGNIARTCAATGTQLHLIEPMGFTITDARLKRAGLDYWDSIQPQVHRDFEAWRATAGDRRFHLFSTGARRSYLDERYQAGDAFVFGPETRGLSDSLLARYPDHVLGIPIQTQHVRSLNLSAAAALVLYEALRQIHARAQHAGPRP